MVVHHFRRTVVQMACCNMYIGPGAVEAIEKAHEDSKHFAKHDICPGLFRVDRSCQSFKKNAFPTECLGSPWSQIELLTLYIVVVTVETAC